MYLLGQTGKRNRMKMKEYPYSLDGADGLQVFLFEQGIRATNFELLSGGYTSTVFRAALDGQPTIIKHARNRDSFYPIRQVMSETRIRTEAEVLTYLHPLFPTVVPNVLQFYPEQDVLLMTDVGQDAQLGFPYLLEGKAESIHARALGRFLAELKQETADWQPFSTIEQPFEQIWTRGMEVDLAYPAWGERMRNTYLSQQKFVWPDGHPKNVLFGNSGSPVRAIDFYCCHFGDPDYMLPNFFGQIPVFSIFGYITPQQAAQFIGEMIQAYTEVEPISPENEQKMLFYAGTQTIQRQDGKWLFEISRAIDDEALRKKAFIFYFGRKTIVEINSFDQYIQEVEKGINW